MSFTKLSSSIVLSTVWGEPHHVRIVWITMLALCDAGGHVSASIPGLASAARVTLVECEQALATFLAPDAYSRTKNHEGRRIEVVDGGWRLLNHALYRAGRDPETRRVQNREAQVRHRQRVSAADVADSADGADKADCQPQSAHADADADADADRKGESEGERVNARAAKPRKKTWRRFPTDYVPDEADRTLAAKLSVNLEAEHAKIRNHEFKRGRSDAQATFQNWLRQAAEFKGNGGRGRNGPPIVQRGGIIRETDGSWLEGGSP